MLSSLPLHHGTWLDAQVYLTPRNDRIEQFIHPPDASRRYQEKPQLHRALQLLSRCAPGGGCNRRDFATECLNTNPTQFPGDENDETDPEPRTITRSPQQLIDWGLIEESFCDRSKKAKQYCRPDTPRRILRKRCSGRRRKRCARTELLHLFETISG